MAKNLTASDRKSLIRLASTMEKGSRERRAILAGLKKAWGGPRAVAGDPILDSFHWAITMNSVKELIGEVEEWWSVSFGPLVLRIARGGKFLDDRGPGVDWHISDATNNKLISGWRSGGVSAWRSSLPSILKDLKKSLRRRPYSEDPEGSQRVLDFVGKGLPNPKDIRLMNFKKSEREW
jgi:hypothetical protein